MNQWCSWHLWHSSRTSVWIKWQLGTGYDLEKTGMKYQRQTTKLKNIPKTGKMDHAEYISQQTLKIWWHNIQNNESS